MFIRGNFYDSVQKKMKEQEEERKKRDHLFKQEEQCLKELVCLFTCLFLFTCVRRNEKESDHRLLLEFLKRQLRKVDRDLL